MQRETIRLVDVVHPVGGEKQQAVEILQHAQEHADHGVHGDAVVAAFDGTFTTLGSARASITAPQRWARVRTSRSTVSIGGYALSPAVGGTR